MSAQRTIVQAMTTVVGLGLMGLGVYLAVTHEGAWGLWGATLVLAPLGVGVLLALPGPVARALETVAPYVPFLHTHEES